METEKQRTLEARKYAVSPSGSNGQLWQRTGEKPNIITVAWTGTVCTNPPMVYISVRPERYSYDIIRETGEFVINLTTEKLAEGGGLLRGALRQRYRQISGYASDAGTILQDRGTHDRGMPGESGVCGRKGGGAWIPSYVSGKSSGCPCG